MGYYNIITFIWMMVLFVYSRKLLKIDPKIRERFLKGQILLVFLYNIAMLFVFPAKIPIELSTTSYFVVPIIVLFNIRYLKSWSVYTSIIMGFVYFTGMILMGQTLYGHFPPYSVLTSLFNHGTLMAYAYITLHTTKFYKKERYTIWIGIIVSASWALLMRPFITLKIRIFIYEVLDGEMARYFFPDNLRLSLIIYYVLFVITLYLSSNVVHLLSNRIYKD